MKPPDSTEDATKRNRAPPRPFLNERRELLNPELTIKLAPKFRRRTFSALEPEDVFERHRTLPIMIYHVRV
jgi:hypothetical protein